MDLRTIYHVQIKYIHVNVLLHLSNISHDLANGKYIPQGLGIGEK